MPATTLTTQDVQDFIDQHSVSARLLRNVGHTPTVPAAAAALGVHPDQIVKTLLFLVDTGAPSDNATAVVVISNGTNRVDKKALAARFDVGKQRVKLAPPDVVLELLGYAAGGVPPFAHRMALPTLMDASVAALAERFDDCVYAGGGDDVTMMELSVMDLRRIVQPEVLPLSES